MIEEKGEKVKDTLRRIRLKKRAAQGGPLCSPGFCSEGKHHAHHRGGEDEENGVDLFQRRELHAQEHHHRQRDGGPVGVAGKGALQPRGGAEQGDPGHLEHGGGDEGHRGCPKAVEHSIHHLGLAEFLQELGDDEDDDNDDDNDDGDG